MVVVNFGNATAMATTILAIMDTTTTSTIARMATGGQVAITTA